MSDSSNLIITHEIYVEFVGRNIIASVHTVEGDTSMVHIKAHLLQNGEPIDLTNTTVYLVYGGGSQIQGTPDTDNTGVVTFELDDVISYKYGTYHPVIKIVDGNGAAHSQSFDLVVERNPGNLPNPLQPPYKRIKITDGSAEADLINILKFAGATVTKEGDSVVVTFSGSGTSDYEDLTSKPQINGHTLTGNKSSSDLEIGGTEVVGNPSGTPTSNLTKLGIGSTIFGILENSKYVTVSSNQTIECSDITKGVWYFYVGGGGTSFGNSYTITYKHFKSSGTDSFSIATPCAIMLFGNYEFIAYGLKGSGTRYAVPHAKITTLMGSLDTRSSYSGQAVYGGQGHLVPDFSAANQLLISGSPGEYGGDRPKWSSVKTVNGQSILGTGDIPVGPAARYGHYITIDFTHPNTSLSCYVMFYWEDTTSSAINSRSKIHSRIFHSIDNKEMGVPIAGYMADSPFNPIDGVMRCYGGSSTIDLIIKFDQSAGYAPPLTVNLADTSVYTFSYHDVVKDLQEEE